MNTLRNRSFFLIPGFGIFLAGFLVLAVFAFSLLQDQADRLRQRTYDETGMAVVLIRLHYEKLMGNLAEVEHTPTMDTADMAILEFDILLERVASLPGRPSYEFLLDEETLAIQQDLLAALRAQLPRIDRAADGQAQALLGMRADLARLRPDVEKLANYPVQIASARRAEMATRFAEAGVWFAWTIGGLLVAGLIFTVIIWWQFSLAAKRERRLKDLADNLQQARDEAEAASRAKSDFLSHMSHELRTPMNAILGFAQILEMGKLDEKQTLAVSQILGSGALLLHLIDQVLELNRINSNRVHLDVAAVNIDDVVQESLALVEQNAHDCGVTTAQDIRHPLPVLQSDHNRIKQVLINLLSNAIKYNHTGGHATVRVEPIVPDRVRFSVVDDGDGIPEDRQGDVFEPFNRLGRESQSIEGTGIGLTITRDLVLRLGGIVDFESTPGQGSTFWFDLPLSPDAPIKPSRQNGS